MNEEWRAIEGFEGYEVSNYGKVRSLSRVIMRSDGRRKTINPRFLVQKTNKDGRKFVCLMNKGKAKYFLVHRLVAMAFIPNPLNKPNIDHIDGNHTNNHVENLRWVTQKENMNNPISIQRNRVAKLGKKRSHESVLKQSKAVIQLTMSGEFVAEFWSAREASRKTGIDTAHICDCCKNKIDSEGYPVKTAGGYKWKYAV